MNTAKSPILFLALLGLGLCVLFTQSLHAQNEVDERAVINFKEGLGFFDPDSLFGVNIRFRMQNRIGMSTTDIQDLTPQEFEANVRRLRLRFDGFLGKKNLTYYIQLSFSRGDQDWDANGFPGIVRDAMVFYTFSPNFYMGFGQGKLPGNRQRVVSSGSQQFTDRSRLNALFNIDRDFGVMAYYENKIATMPFKLKGSISSGEGRNVTKTDNGLAYTCRFEWLPLGDFQKEGDFFEGDLAREQSPRVSLAYSYSFNHKAQKTLGQRGAYMPASQDIKSTFLDIMAKYRGWALAAEYAQRAVDNHSIFLVDDSPVYAYTGSGYNLQLSYLFPSRYEVAARYTYTRPNQRIRAYDYTADIYMLGLTRYWPNHRNKLQFNVSYNNQQWEMNATKDRKFLNFMVQLETGI